LLDSLGAKYARPSGLQTTHFGRPENKILSPKAQHKTNRRAIKEVSTNVTFAVEQRTVYSRANDTGSRAAMWEERAKKKLKRLQAGDALFELYGDCSDFDVGAVELFLHDLLQRAQSKSFSLFECHGRRIALLQRSLRAL
jgi:predicted secreted protein